MKKKKTAIVIGTGGATMARELQGEYQVTIMALVKKMTKMIGMQK